MVNYQAVMLNNRESNPLADKVRCRSLQSQTSEFAKYDLRCHIPATILFQYVTSMIHLFMCSNNHLTAVHPFRSLFSFAIAITWSAFSDLRIFSLSSPLSVCMVSWYTIPFICCIYIYINERNGVPENHAHRGDDSEKILKNRYLCWS